MIRIAHSAAAVLLTTSLAFAGLGAGLGAALGAGGATTTGGATGCCRDAV